MIRVENLRKVYGESSKSPCEALRGVSFTLPDRGMVFVVGKSGSGKSTLLHLLGGLDAATSGDVVVGGRRFSEFSEGDYDSYRSSYVGFVFQDFCLLDSMTVEENVRLSLDLLGENADDRVREVLELLELSELSDRYPRELSGGQKQRVALGRALVKQPRMILADEPTGNLDRRTAAQVLGALKRLSGDRLVVIVSHSAADADEYADRIIELADGRVTRDVSRSREAAAPLIEGDTVTLPTRRLTREELALINEAAKKGAKLTQCAEDFVPTVGEGEGEDVPYTPTRHRLTVRRGLYLSARLTRGNRIHGALTALLVSVLIVLLSVSRVFALFDGRALIRESIEKNPTYSFSLYKGYRRGTDAAALLTDKQVEVTEADVAAFYGAGYEGNVYKLYNVGLGLREATWNVLELGGHVSYADTRTLFVDFGGGVLECDEAFLAGLYGTDGHLTVLAGDVNEPTPRALIITDYFADCILSHCPQYKTYGDILDAVAIGHTRFDVKAIVRTGYTDRHAELLSEYSSLMALPWRERASAFERLKESEAFLALYREIKEYLAIGYYFGDDYEQQEIAYVQSRGGTSLDNPYLIIDGERAEGRQWSYTPRAEQAVGTVSLTPSHYNHIMGTDYTADELRAMLPFAITLLDYPYHTSEGDPVYERTLTVTDVSYGPVLLNYRDYLELYAVHLYPHALYFDNAESAAAVYMEIEGESDFFSSDELFKTVYTVMNVITVFEDFFLLLYVGLLGVSALLYVSFARRSVKRRTYEVGVLRALGIGASAVSRLFMYDLLAVGAVIAVVSLTAVVRLDPVLNTVLSDNLAAILNTVPLRELHILHFSFLSALIDVATVLALSALSSLAAFRFCRRLRPIAIIRNKD